MTEFPKTVLEFIKYFFTKYRIYIIIMLLLNILIAAYFTIQPYVLKKLIDTAIPFLGQKALITATLAPVLLLIVLSTFNNFCWRLNNYVMLKSIPNLKADIIEQSSDFLRRHSFKFFQDNLSGAVSNRVIDLSNNADSLLSNLRELFQRLLTIVFSIGIAMVASPVFSIIFFVWTLLFMRAAFYFSKGIEPFSKFFAKSRSHTIGVVVDSFANAISVILFAREDYEKKYLRHSLDQMVDKDKFLQKKLMNYAVVLSGMIISAQILTLIFLIYLGSKGYLTVGDFVLIFMLLYSVLEEVWRFTEGLFRVAEQWGVFNQALQFISQKHDIIDKSDAVPLKIESGTIVFSRVKFFYNESQKLFEDKTLVIQGSEKVGLVGFSGSGKTSFVNLITRTFDIQSGDILIDNQSIKNITLTSLRENIAFIPQDPTLFHRTLMENIRYGNINASDQEVIEAAKKANVHEFAIELPNGYESVVGERGIKLSGGQRQRLAIARAILKNAPILILDEATSALDSATEALIQKSLQYAMRNKTVIVIAHRLSTIQAMDRILVFDKGHIVEEGSHFYLLEKGIIYPNLWKIQQGYLSYAPRES